MKFAVWRLVGDPKQAIYRWRGGKAEQFIELSKDKNPFVNPDKNRLEQLASNTNGAVFYPNQMEQLIKSLVENQNYIPIQKTTIKKSPLIDWSWLLLLLIASLAIEWFTRKYNGLL